MRTTKFLLFILLSFTMTCAWADMLPRPAPRPAPQPAPQPTPEPGTQPALQPAPQAASQPGDVIHLAPPEAASEIGVSMASADVKVRIRKQKADLKAGEKISMLLVDVSGAFDLVCSAAPKGGKDLDVVFPIEYEDERPPTPVRFDVAVDGKRASHVKRDTWSVTDEHNRPRTQWGYAWRLPGLKGGQKRRISVRYSIVLPQNQGKAHFIYFLRSGARWDGPIGREAVNITVDRGLRMEVLSPTALTPEQRSDTSITWTITKAKPAEDIRLVIVSGAKP